MNKKKANITFLVLMIMFISSLLWLLVSQYIQYMIKTAAIFQNYYTTYYMAYWWLELWLTQVKYHWYWFENTVTITGESCRTDTCQAVTTITSRSAVIADAYESWSSCPALDASWSDSNQSYMGLWSWDCFIVPLYFDASSWFNAIDYTKIASNDFLLWTYNPSLYNRYATWTSWTWETYSMRIIDESLSNLDSLLEPTVSSNWYSFWSSMPAYSGSSINYLIVANPSTTSKEFCLEVAWGNELPMKYISIVTIAEDWDNTIALNAIKNNELPSFLCYWAINP